MAQDKEATKDCIFTALTGLMEQKEYKYITVTDIARKAGVSRMTYYRTYTSKEDILVQHFRKISQQLISEAKEDIRQALDSFFSYFQKYDNLTRVLTEADLMNVVVECFSGFTDHLYNALHPGSLNTTKARYAVRYESGGLFSILIGWLSGSAEESPQEMSEIALNILRGE
ncbi:MAG: TetR/AcrR family transcriptional regulator [Lachnospiraceae bacterium]|nr:TetR/AcrR family transcriptional regulator [Lachnospiraceae bacterium]